MRNREKLIVGPRVRRLRESRGWKLEECAAKLGVSVSYLSQIETNRRPVTARVLLAMMQLFETDASAFSPDEELRLAADLREALLEMREADPPVSIAEIKQAATSTPSLAHRFLALHRAYRRLEERVGIIDEALSFDDRGSSGTILPYEEVRDYFHYRDNYIHKLDAAAERLAEEIGPDADDSPEFRFERWLGRQHGVTVQRVRDLKLNVLRSFAASDRTVLLNAAVPAETRAFQLAYQVAALQFGDLVELELEDAKLRSAEARNVCRIGLFNYAAGALLMPYARFLAAAQDCRHDLEILRLRFHASIEQVAHRLSNLQRPGARGVPFYFLRIDQAGNITKRHSATRLQFARFGGACPLWNVHESFARPGEFLVQLAETPDNVRYLSIATSVVKRPYGFGQPGRRYALALGCEIIHAKSVVYADALDLTGAPQPIGISCRICERRNCSQRAFPALGHSIEVPQDVREVLPYRLNELPLSRGDRSGRD